MFLAVRVSIGDPLACLMLILERLGSMVNIHMPEKEGGETLIIAACRIGNLAIVKFLMSLGAQVTHEIEVITVEAGQ